jgi:hypothetical protein
MGGTTVNSRDKSTPRIIHFSTPTAKNTTLDQARQSASLLMLKPWDMKIELNIRR